MQAMMGSEERKAGSRAEGSGVRCRVGGVLGVHEIPRQEGLRMSEASLCSSLL